MDTPLPPPRRDMTKVLRLLKASLLQTLQYVDDLSVAIESTDDQPAKEIERPPVEWPRVHIDHRSCTIAWHDRQCHLGYTLAFRLIEVLARRPDHYLSIDYLLSEIWSGQRSRSAVRSAVSDLRCRLVDAGMDDLAAMIDGSNRGHYGLMLSRR